MKYDIITITGATAGGKTSLATHLAHKIKGEIISADSRQVYRGMDIGTGKDIDEYIVDNEQIPYHLIDIVDAGKKYNVFEYQKDFLSVYEAIKARKNMPVLCGGTGMYIEAVLKGYKLINVPPNKNFRKKAETLSDKQLQKMLEQHKNLHNISDTSNRKRLIRAVEIAEYYSRHPEIDHYFPAIKSLNIQVVFNRDERRRRISQRLKERLENGMIEEVQRLLNAGIDAETLIYYGLEYKFITMYLQKQMSYSEMHEKLEIAIHQFSKRQMTWFRKMERAGFIIHKIEGHLPMSEKTERVLQLLNQ